MAFYAWIQLLTNLLDLVLALGGPFIDCNVDGEISRVLWLQSTYGCDKLWVCMHHVDFSYEFFDDYGIAHLPDSQWTPFKE